MSHSTKFWDRMAERYSRKPVVDEAAYQKKLRLTREYLRADMEVLEFGCGTGSTAIAHAPFVKHIHATDISSRMIEIAQDKARAADIDNVTFEQSTIEELSVRDQSVDAVLGLSILHLLENREQAIAKVHRMLKPGGRFVTNTMCLGDTMKWFRFIGPIGRFLGLIPLVKVFTAKELEYSLNSGGFEIEHRSQPGTDKAVFIVAKKR